jgi:hypothetical protein
MAMNNNLAAKSDEVVSAVQTLEILQDFRAEVSRQVESLQDIRRSLTEIAMLETAVGRAVRVLEPLVNIGNLRRLTDEEVRAAARTVLESRSTRLGQNIIEVKPAPIAPATAGKPESAPVPFPIEN